jgi:hypothetical protein
MFQIGGMDLIKSKKIGIILLFILFSSSCTAQTSTNKKEGIACCVETQLKKEDTTNGYTIYIDNEILSLEEKNASLIKLSAIDSVKSWIEIANLKSLQVYYLHSDHKKYFLLSSEVIGATGLATNFYQWLIIDVNRYTVVSANLLSLSNDASMFFFKEGVLNIKILDYGDDFFRKERDWNNVPIKVITYKEQGNTLKKVSQIDMFCKCQ